MRCVLQKKIFFLDYDEDRMRLRLNSGNRAMAALVGLVGPLFCRDTY